MTGGDVTQGRALQRLEAVRADDAQAPLTLLPHGDEADVSQHLSMLRDSLLRDVEVRRDLAD